MFKIGIPVLYRMYSIQCILYRAYSVGPIGYNIHPSANTYVTSNSYNEVTSIVTKYE